MKNKKSLIFVIMAIVIVAVIGFVIFTLVTKDSSGGVFNKKTEFDHVTVLLDEYNVKNEGRATDVLLMESETDLAFMINDFIEIDDKQKQVISINFTKMQIDSIICDENLEPIRIINMSIDNQYTVKEVDIYDYELDKLITYDNNDEEIEEYKEISIVMVNKIKEIFNETSLNGITLFYKTLEDVKGTKISK